MRAGQVVADRFEVERLAGRGGMATVYRALDRLTRERVALKLLMEDDDPVAGRFMLEAQVLSELKHPGIVRYVAHGKTPAGEHYLAMEWLEGIDLSDRLGDSGITVADTLKLATRAADALGVAHAHGVVHRDISPGNLFLPDGDIAKTKIIDFGIARVNGPSLVRRTATGIVLGTLGYMAPEQVRGATALDARVDVFALGCVLYQCLIGAPPFVAEDSAVALLAKILLDEPVAIELLRTDVPPALSSLVMRMLAKNPDRRPADGAAVAAELASMSTVGDGPRASASIRPAALTASEQRMVCVVLAGRPPLKRGAAPVSSRERAATTEALRIAVEPYGVLVEQLVDGSVVATPIGLGAATDQAAHSARCALAIRAILPDTPMAVATGRVLVGQPWSLGEVIDQAARFLAEDEVIEATRASPRHSRPIRLDKVTAGLLDERFDLGGDAAGLTLLGERAALEATRTLLGRPSRCVGRDRELSALDGFFQECVSEPMARAVIVTAPAGVGKSRIRYEFLHALREKKRVAEIWVGRGDPISVGSPFNMLASAIRAATGVLDGETLFVKRQKLLARVSRHIPEHDVPRVTAFVGELIGVPFDDTDDPSLSAARQDAMLMGDQMRRAWEDWLGAECNAQPVVIVLEDLHWGDLPSVRFIDAALRNLSDRPLLVLALARPEVHDLFPDLWKDRGAQEIRLGELSRRACEVLIRDVLGERADADIVRRLVGRAAGNAFYLEELIRAVAEGRGEDLPDTVLAMVQARLDALEPEARLVLRAASVFGQVFWRGGVLQLLGGTRRAPQYSRWFDELASREMITLRGGGKFREETEYVFRHALLRDSAYAMLTATDRELGHRLAGEWLENAGESAAMTLAEHFERGGRPAGAVAWFRRAAEQALEGNDFVAAVERAERGISNGATGELLGALKFIQAEAHKWRGEFAKAESCAAEAIEILPRFEMLWFLAVGELAMASGRLGNYGRLEELARGLLEHGVVTASGAEVVAWERVTMHLLHAGRYEIAEALLDRIGVASSEMARRDPLVAARVQQARGHRALVSGDPAVALVEIEAAGTGFEQGGDLRRSCLQRSSLGYLSMEVGAYTRAETALRDTLAAAERMGLHNVTADAKHNLGLALARLGSLDEARRIETEALETFRARGDRRMEGGSRVYLATILALSGDYEHAEREARTAVDVLQTTPPIRAFALATLANVQLARGAVPDALASAEEAMRLLDSLGQIETGESLARLVYAQTLRAAGEIARAESAIAIARERLLTRAAKISDATMRQSFLERIPENSRTISLANEWLAAAPTPAHT